MVPAVSETVPPLGFETAVTVRLSPRSTSLSSAGQVGGRDHDVGVLGAIGGVVDRAGRVVDAGDVDGDVAGVGRRAVGDLVVEAALARAAQVGRRGEGDGAALEDDLAAGGVPRVGDRQRVVGVDVGVVVQDRVGDVGPGVLGDGDGVVVGRRGIVLTGEVDRDRARRGAAVAVLDRVVEGGRVVAAQVGVRREGDLAGVEDGRAALGFETPVTVRLSPSVSVSSSARSEAVITTAVSSVPEASLSVAAGLSFSQVMLTSA